MYVNVGRISTDRGRMMIEGKEEKVEANRNYPYIAKFEIFDKHYWYVLFTSRNKGTCIFSDKKVDIGKYQDCWSEDAFSYFSGVLKLENK